MWGSLTTKNRRTTVPVSEPEPTTTETVVESVAVSTCEPVEPAIVPAVDSVPIIDVPARAALVDIMVQYATRDGSTVTATGTVPGYVLGMVTAIQTVLGTVRPTLANFAALVAAFRHAFTESTGIVFPDPPVPNRSPMHVNVTETQNAAYVAWAVSGVPFDDIGAMIVWRAMLPVTTCRFETTGVFNHYGTRTLGRFVADDHGNVPGNASASIVRTWYAAGSRGMFPAPIATVIEPRA